MEEILIIMGLIIFVFILKLDEEFSLKRYIDYMPVMIFFFLSVVVNYTFVTKIEFVKNLIEQSLYPFAEKVTVILFCMALSLIYSPIFIALLQKIHEKNIIRRTEKKIKPMEYMYYREILNNISPAILSYSHNGKIIVEDAVVAILLNLKLKKYIEIENNEIIILKDIENLLEHERLVLEKIRAAKYDEGFFKRVFKVTLKQEMISRGYLKEIKNDRANIVYSIEIIMLWMILFILTTMPVFLKVTNNMLVLIGVYATTFLCIPIYKFLQSKINVTSRTEVSLELGAKIRGVRNYIKDYSSITDNNIEIINLYDEFVIYAIILDMKGKLNDDCKKMYEQTKNLVINFRKK